MSAPWREYSDAAKARALEAGLCVQCLRRPRADATKCSKCRDRANDLRRPRQARRRAEAIARGMCAECYQRPAVTQLCEECQGRANERQARYKARLRGEP